MQWKSGGNAKANAEQAITILNSIKSEKLKLKKVNKGAIKKTVEHVLINFSYPTRWAILIEKIKQKVTGITIIIIIKELVLALISTGAPS